jgi:hypothetical protein
MNLMAMPSAPALAMGAAAVAATAVLLAPGLNVPPVMMGANLFLSWACYWMTSKMSVAMRDTFIKVTHRTEHQSGGALWRSRFVSRQILTTMPAIGPQARLFGIDLNKPETKRDEHGEHKTPARLRWFYARTASRRASTALQPCQRTCLLPALRLWLSAAPKCGPKAA